MFFNKKVITIIIIVIAIYYICARNIYHSADSINSFLNYFCSDPSVFNPKDFKWTEKFRSNWMNIKNEYSNYTYVYTVPLHSKINNIVARADQNNGWKTLYLRAFGVNTDVSKYFPLTMNLINLCPCTLAFFSVISPGAKLRPHIGVYKGVIRYHLALIVPTDKENCFINIDNKKLHWTEGSDIMFDDMFEHYVENNTTQPRVVLFLDIKRDFHNTFINMINSLFLRFVKSNDALTDTVTNINNYHTSQ